jgi:endo-1,4-beta-xylanase
MVTHNVFLMHTELKRLNRIPAIILHAAFMGIFLIAANSQAQPAKGATKFFGNICGNSVRSDFLTYWNQISPENSAKWASVEGTQDRYNFGGIDAMRNFADSNHISWKLHTLIWGSQYPNWITKLSQAEQLAEITEWYDTLAKRYPTVTQIDVINEGYPSHKPPPFKAALGGDGSTGYDWIVKSFKMARERWPNATLIYNDYNNIEWNSEVSWTVTMVNAIKKAGAPIDAIGCQAHDAHRTATNTLKSNLDKLASTGLPLYITEFDIPDGNDASQKTKMQDKVTLFWNHPKVLGITYWGYIVGQTWVSGSGLLSSSGTARPALTWLIDYLKSNPKPPNDFPTGTISPDAPFVTPSPAAAMLSDQGYWQIFDLRGRVTGAYQVNDRLNSFSSRMPKTGCFVVKHTGRSAGIITTVR